MMSHNELEVSYDGMLTASDIGNPLETGSDTACHSDKTAKCQQR